MNRLSDLKISAAVFCFFSLVFVTACSKENSTASAPANTGSASSAPVPRVRSSADVVKVTAAEVSLAAGGNIEAQVTLSISPGFHVNANPATFSYLIPTEVTPGQAEGITIGKPAYPAAVQKKFQFADQPLAVYEAEAPIKLNLRAEKNAASGPRSLPITITVQACDEEQCFPPATIKSAVPVTVK